MRTGRFRFIERRKHLFSRERIQVLQVELKTRAYPDIPMLEWVDASPSDALCVFQALNGQTFRYGINRLSLS